MNTDGSATRGPTLSDRPHPGASGDPGQLGILAAFEPPAAIAAGAVKFQVDPKGLESYQDLAYQDLAEDLSQAARRPVLVPASSSARLRSSSWMERMRPNGRSGRVTAREAACGVIAGRPLPYSS
jgi:hypothetical protein